MPPHASIPSREVDPAAALRALRARALRPPLAHALLLLVQAAGMVAAVLTWRTGWWPATVGLWAVVAWLDHASLTRLHEAGHGMLARIRWLNELEGIAIGTASLIPMSVYRYVHARHHAHLGNPRDPEFWPYSLPSVPRWVRVTYAWSELAFGWLLTPVLYSVRTAATWESVPRGQRGRIVAEWILLIAFWGGLLALVHARGWWEPFVVAHLVPAWLAGTMQTVRKFVEHLGMYGEGIVGMTRIVVYRGPIGRAASASQLHVEHHATHHRHARIPYYVLPEATEHVLAQEPPERVFRTHLGAIRDMLPSLLDPRVGPAWRNSG